MFTLQVHARDLDQLAQITLALNGVLNQFDVPALAPIVEAAPAPAVAAPAAEEAKPAKKTRAAAPTTDAPAPSQASPASPSDEPAPAPVAPSAPTYTLEQVRKHLAGLSQVGKTDAVKDLLRAFGATKLGDVPVDQYPALMAAAAEL